MGYHITAPAPDGDGALRSMRNALRNAKLDLLAKYGEQLSPFYWAAFITVGEASTPIGIEQQ